MNTNNISKVSGHRGLAKMGKRVLRSGRRKLTQTLTATLNITEEDHITESAPGHANARCL
ncbi:hypothetical protein [Niabella soli]|uniref:hypothetical protein n=1 Tax=Niabella soli TaxID=446683 RepID=UPI0002499C12|nr:hypothetical protein [Niabella soli]